MDIVDQIGLPFLRGGVSLDNVCATIKLTKEATITFNWTKQIDTIPLYRSQSGHYRIIFFPMSQDNDNIVTCNILDNVKVSYKMHLPQYTSLLTMILGIS